MKFYEMYADTCIEDYVSLDVNSFDENFTDACYRSEFQYLDHQPIEVEISTEGGLTFPDFLICGGCIPLVSEKLRRIFDSVHVDNLFYKPITLTFNQLGYAEHYYLALPPRIDCLNREESIIEIEENEYALPEELMKTITKIVVNPFKAGNYKIFKLPSFSSNTEIIITDELKKLLERNSLENVNFLEL
ncbi:MAG: hypothetical protein K6G55_06575 [Selenomonadaceae bacterium]|nr:hypothetical protein [Selenomonadaceae bacterium]